MTEKIIMKTGQQIRIKSTQEVGVILEINDDLVKVYIQRTKYSMKLYRK